MEESNLKWTSPIGIKYCIYLESCSICLHASRIARLISQNFFQKEKYKLKFYFSRRTNLIMILIYKEEFFSISNCSECRKICKKWLKNVNYVGAIQEVMKPKEATAYFCSSGILKLFFDFLI